VDALHDIALMIAAETELDRVLARVLRATESLLGAASACVFLRDDGTTHGRRYTTLETGDPHWEARSEEVRPGGITDQVLSSGVTLASEDLQNDPRASLNAKALRSGAVLATPLRCQGEVIGVLYANFAGARALGTSERHIAETLGAHAATAVRNARLIEAERRLAERQAGLLDLARALSSPVDLHAIFEQMARHGRILLGADEVSLHRLRPDGSLFCLHQDPTPATQIEDRWLPDRFIRGVMESRTPAIVPRPAGDPDTSRRWVEHLRSVELAAAVPIQTDREVIGVMICLWRRAHEPRHVDRALLETLGRHAAIAAQTARAYEQAVSSARLDGAIKTPRPPHTSSASRSPSSSATRSLWSSPAASRSSFGPSRP